MLDSGSAKWSVRADKPTSIEQAAAWESDGVTMVGLTPGRLNAKCLQVCLQLGTMPMRVTVTGDR